jgi:hypothetical protein
MRELGPGIWHWQALHPDREERSPWSREVSSYAIELGDGLVRRRESPRAATPWSAR